MGRAGYRIVPGVSQNKAIECGDLLHQQFVIGPWGKDPERMFQGFLPRQESLRKFSRCHKSSLDGSTAPLSPRFWRQVLLMIILSRMMMMTIVTRMPCSSRSSSSPSSKFWSLSWKFLKLRKSMVKSVSRCLILGLKTNLRARIKNSQCPSRMTFSKKVKGGQLRPDDIFLEK